jgi:uncharacterized protein (TIGR00730 family)
MTAISSLCVFCGSSPGRDPDYLDAAKSLGLLLAGEGITLVYGGASIGLMGELADASLYHGGKVVGVIPDFMRTKEIAHAGLSDMIVVDSMHARKAKMADLADGFIALPGGMGTLEEFCEVVTWAQLGLHRKPCGLLNVKNFYNPLIAFLDSMAAEGFVYDKHRGLILAESKPENLLKAMRDYTPIAGDKLLRAGRT